MERDKIIHTVWLLLIPVIVGIMVMDLQYRFGNSDLPFFLAIGAYILFVVLSRVQSKTTIKIVLCTVLVMGVNYMDSGASRSTERLGEWFYIYFLIGFVQYFIEALLMNRTKI